MTGPIIPADQWPEMAMCHCWDKSGTGKFYGVRVNSHGIWGISIEDGIPMPAGHDWRTPVMLLSERALAIDLLQQAADVIRELQQCITVGRPAGNLHAHAADVLALIDAHKGE